MRLLEKIDYVRTNIFDPGEAMTEAVLFDGGGCYQAFANANFYENPGGDCYEVHGLIRDKYVEFYEIEGDMGFPASDEVDDPDVAGGRLNAFDNGRITWSPDSGVEVYLTPSGGSMGPSVGPGAADWQAVLVDPSSSADAAAAVIAQIRAQRDAVPAHVKPAQGGYVYFGKTNPKPASIVAGSIEDWIWQEVGSEGPFDSINAYDNQTVTWGKGIAKPNLPALFKALFAKNSGLEAAFKAVGVAFGPDGGLQVVKTDDASVATGDAAFQAMKADPKLLDFLADVPTNADYQSDIFDAQWNFVMQFNPGFVAHVTANQWSKDAVQLAFHLSFWLPGYGWRSDPAAYKATNGDPTKIILLFKKKQVQFAGELVSHLKTFAGNSFQKYIALEPYAAELPADQCATFADAGTIYYVPL